MFRQLIVRGVLAVDHGSYGALFATASAKPILRGEEPVHLRRDQAGRSALNTIKKKERIALGAEAEGLYEALRAERTRLAREQNVPAYVIFHDATLAAIATARPQSLAALGDIRHGRTKIEQYGEVVLQVIQAQG